MKATSKSPHNILLAVDGSDHSKAAVQLVADLPLSHETEITAISVMVPRHAQFSPSFEKMLEGTKTLLEGNQARVQTEVIAGYPAEIINLRADQIQPQLTVLGAKGLRSTLGILLGGVAQQVVEYSCCPVLIVRAPYTGIKRVLLIVDGSEHSQQAVQYLATFPLPKKHALHLMHVMPPIYQVDYITQAWPTGMDVTPPIPIDNIEKRVQEQAEADGKFGQELLEQTQHHLREFGLESTPVLERGDAATQIIEYTKGHKIDLIIAGSRGLGQVQSWLLGSLSRKLVHYAGCSVLIVK